MFQAEQHHRSHGLQGGGADPCDCAKRPWEGFPCQHACARLVKADLVSAQPRSARVSISNFHNQHILVYWKHYTDVEEHLTKMLGSKALATIKVDWGPPLETDPEKFDRLVTPSRPVCPHCPGSVRHMNNDKAESCRLAHLERQEREKRQKRWKGQKDQEPRPAKRRKKARKNVPRASAAVNV